MFKMLHYVLEEKLFRRSYVLKAIYNFVDSNKRDSFAWQRGFLKAGGDEKLREFWLAPESDTVADEEWSDRYWVIAIAGRMMGTCQESRVQLIKQGFVDYILEGCKSNDQELRECSVCALKGLIHHPEGREVVTYTTLLECLVSGSKTS
eukprot:TRINITY_DN60841_c0_g1_i1.p1 TRINITY_DN60841_c0_g1~~TRINITY_DN60841_c0_g1_i1.p1  ORF type:complete len:149 (-),score=26.61 TRINITY_DN60841_c0_g1_i1:136-582(-)